MRLPSLLTIIVLMAAGGANTATAQDVLPFPPAPSASQAGVTIESSTYQKRVEPKRLPEDAPNILIDDVGAATPSTYGGEINTPTLDRIAGLGISYNRFHSTAMCSPTRAALLTGRNHTLVGNGQIAAIANDFDGFSGVIPKSSATIAEVLKAYGYNTGVWGKWHNTPEEQITSKGPFDHWPTGYGFEYFYGFLAGEASQYEPTLVRNTSYVERPKTTGGNDHYHLSEDIADDAIHWLREQKSYAPDKPFFMYWAPGASHGPHQVMKEWADRYKGKFDDGWDAYRERVFANQKRLGKVDSLVTMEVDVPPNANGVLYALAGFSGGITCYVKDGFLCYEFNLIEIQRTKLKSQDKLPLGKVAIEIESRLVDKIGGPMVVTLRVNGASVAKGRVPAAMSLHFTSNATFDIGTDLDSPVSLDYFDQVPFAFNGTIGTTKTEYLNK